LNFFPSTGTIFFQGSLSGRSELEIAFESAISGANIEQKGAIERNWRDVDFGKYRTANRSLPQIVVHDPGWFFYVFNDGAYRGKWQEMFSGLAEKATSIRLPPAYRAGQLEHLVGINHSYRGFRLVRMKDARDSDHKVIKVSNSLDLSYAFREFNNEPFAQRKLLRSFKLCYVDTGVLSLSRNGIERFFDNDANFDL